MVSLQSMKITFPLTNYEYLLYRIIAINLPHPWRQTYWNLSPWQKITNFASVLSEYMMLAFLHPVCNHVLQFLLHFLPPFPPGRTFVFREWQWGICHYTHCDIFYICSKKLRLNYTGELLKTALNAIIIYCISNSLQQLITLLNLVFFFNSPPWN